MNDLTNYLLTRIGDCTLQALLLAMGLIFQREAIQIEIDLLFQFFVNEDPRVVAAAYFAVASFAQAGRSQAGLCLQAGILDNMEVPEGFLEKRECCRCIAALIVNCGVSDMEGLVREEWVDLLADMADAREIEIFQKAMFVIEDWEARQSGGAGGTSSW
jgi:hypothetical protein